MKSPLRLAIEALPPGERLAAALDAIDDLTGQGDLAALERRYRLYRKEAQVLAALNAASPRPVSVDRLIITCWGHDCEVSEGTVQVHISRLRKKLGEGVISNARGRGWFLTERVAA